MNNKLKIRLYVDSPLSENARVDLSEAASHYLCMVMRLKAGDEFCCFNAADGEFAARLETPHKKQSTARLAQRLCLPRRTPDIWLAFAPLKKDRTDFLVEKAVELGVSKLMPVVTRYGITDKIRPERLIAQMTEAAEQCGRFDIPELAATQSFETMLKNWDASRTLYFLDERGGGLPCGEAFAARSAAVLVGPEGGFAPEEAQQLYNLPFVKPVSLGPRILRAETAATAALAVWQAVAGDWKNSCGDMQ